MEHQRAERQQSQESSGLSESKYRKINFLRGGWKNGINKIRGICKEDC